MRSLRRAQPRRTVAAHDGAPAARWPRYDMMDEPERDAEKAGSKAVSFLFLGGMTVTMTAWIVFLGWAAWSLLRDR